jgi:hypothetical protein
MTEILALDVATVCGWARGHVGDVPSSGSIRFGKKPATNNQVFGEALAWISKLLEPQPRPDLLIMEAMLPPDAMKGATSRQVRDRLAGLHGIMRGVAHLRGIGEIAEASVGDIRAHFIFDRRCYREAAKRETLRQCQRLGWPAQDDHAGDACALWSYACALIDPKTALKVSPLWQRRANEQPNQNPSR